MDRLRQVPELSRAGLSVLITASASAQAATASLENFAVELTEVEDHGLTWVQLRWLLASRHIKHLREATGPGDQARSFKPSTSYVFDRTSCFMLTRGGLLFALGQLRANQGGVLPTGEHHDLPAWDEARRELRLGQVVVKRFRVPAGNQVLLLRVFQESGWPPRIDDPLPPSNGIDRRRRLQATISSLNRCRLARRVRFAGDGTGCGVVWKREFRSA